jgi:hypothetical protein
MSRSRGRRYLLAARLNEKPSEGRFGSRADENWLLVPRRLLGVKPTESSGKLTSHLEGLLTEEEQTNWRGAANFGC